MVWSLSKPTAAHSDAKFKIEMYVAKPFNLLAFFMHEKLNTRAGHSRPDVDGRRQREYAKRWRTQFNDFV